jgi:hypothetical protein
MPITDARYAAEIWNTEYRRVRVYDGFTCAVLAASERGELERTDIGFWVTDETEPARWLDARSARYRLDSKTSIHGDAAGPADGQHPLDFATAVATVRENGLCVHPR